MKIGVTATVIGLLIFGALYSQMDGVSDDISIYITNNS